MIRKISLNKEKDTNRICSGHLCLCIYIEINKRQFHIMQAVAESVNVLHSLLGNKINLIEGKKKKRIEGGFVCLFVLAYF